jgi:CheY-like chemotaxis protein
MGATVLFVDDESAVLELYELTYSSEYTVLTATSGEEALDMFGTHIDFAFFDRRMPGMSGDEAIRTIRDEGYETPLGIISAIEPDGTLDIEYEAYHTKPTDKEQVRTTIRKHVLE